MHKYYKLQQQHCYNSAVDIYSYTKYFMNEVRVSPFLVFSGGRRPYLERCHINLKTQKETNN